MVLTDIPITKVSHTTVTTKAMDMAATPTPTPILVITLREITVAIIRKKLDMPNREALSNLVARNTASMTTVAATVTTTMENTTEVMTIAMSRAVIILTLTRDLVATETTPMAAMAIKATSPLVAINPMVGRLLLALVFAMSSPIAITDPTVITLTKVASPELSHPTDMATLFKLLATMDTVNTAITMVPKDLPTAVHLIAAAMATTATPRNLQLTLTIALQLDGLLMSTAKQPLSMVETLEMAGMEDLLLPLPSSLLLTTGPLADTTEELFEFLLTSEVLLALFICFMRERFSGLMERILLSQICSIDKDTKCFTY